MPLPEIGRGCGIGHAGTCSTIGMYGADLFNVMNQTAVKTSVEGLNAINMAVLEYAKDKILMGAEQISAVIMTKSRNVPLIMKRDMH